MFSYVIKIKLCFNSFPMHIVFLFLTNNPQICLFVITKHNVAKNCNVCWNMIILLAHLQNKNTKFNLLFKHIQSKKKFLKLKNYLKMKNSLPCFHWGIKFPKKILASTQALFHFGLPFLDFLYQMMHFCKSIYVDLIQTYFKILPIFSSNVPYWHVLQNAWPK
jgi:hypothetical protein